MLLGGSQSQVTYKHFRDFCIAEGGYFFVNFQFNSVFPLESFLSLQHRFLLLGTFIVVMLIMKALVPASFFKKSEVIMKILDKIGSHLKTFWSPKD